MRYISAYLLAVRGGNANPQAEDIKNILSAAAVGADDERVDLVVNALKGKSSKDIEELIAAGSAKLATISGGVRAASSAAPAAGGAAPAADSKPAKKEEPKDESEIAWSLLTSAENVINKTKCSLEEAKSCIEDDEGKSGFKKGKSANFDLHFVSIKDELAKATQHVNTIISRIQGTTMGELIAEGSASLVSMSGGGAPAAADSMPAKKEEPKEESEIVWSLLTSAENVIKEAKCSLEEARSCIEDDEGKSGFKRGKSAKFDLHLVAIKDELAKATQHVNTIISRIQGKTTGELIAEGSASLVSVSGGGVPAAASAAPAAGGAAPAAQYDLSNWGDEDELGLSWDNANMPSDGDDQEESDDDMGFGLFD